MKKKNLWPGILTTALVFTMMVVGCDNGLTGDNEAPQTVEYEFNSATANGSSMETTTQLTLTFSQAIAGLSAADITLTGVSDVTKGTLSGTGPTYTLPISGFNTGRTLNVAVSKTGYTINGSPKNVTIYYYSGGISSFSDFTYIESGNEVTITGYKGAEGGVNIPAQINGKPVTVIRSEAFAQMTSLTSVTIPNSVISIGGGAFSDCRKLVSVTIGNSVTSIEGHAFSGTGLISVNIPDSVTSMGQAVFASCESLISVTIGSGLTSISANTFRGCSEISNISIPNTITGIEYDAFNDCSSLTSVTFQGTITSADFSSSTPFFGDLRAKYLAEGAGTYITTSPVNNNAVWRKQ